MPDAQATPMHNLLMDLNILAAQADEPVFNFELADNLTLRFKFYNIQK